MSPATGPDRDRSREASARARSRSRNANGPPSIPSAASARPATAARIRMDSDNHSPNATGGRNDEQGVCDNMPQRQHFPHDGEDEDQDEHPRSPQDVPRPAKPTLPLEAAAVTDRAVRWTDRRPQRGDAQPGHPRAEHDRDDQDRHVGPGEGEQPQDHACQAVDERGDALVVHDVERQLVAFGERERDRG